MNFLYIIEVRPIGEQDFKPNSNFGFHRTLESAREAIKSVPVGNPECRIAEFVFSGTYDAEGNEWDEEEDES